MTAMRTLRIGVLALQGAFAEHLAMLRRLDREVREAQVAGTGSAATDAGWRDGAGEATGIEAFEVRLPGQLADVDGLIIPGGESTTIGKLLAEYGLIEPLGQRIAAGFPVLGTCAGAIILARDVGGCERPLIGAMDLTVERNAFGRQLESFEADLVVPALGEYPVCAVFIRAPAIRRAGPDVEVLARLDARTIVAARQGNLLATAFHPELTDDTRLHRYFVGLVSAASRAS